MPIDSFSQFKEHSVAEFFKKNKQMLGFSGKVRSLTTIVHEFTSNSLDAGEEVGILPEIFIQLEEEGDDKYKIAVQDNCGGIPEKYLGKALGQLLAGTKFHRYVQQRGQQGIGASGCIMYSQITTGKPAWVRSGYKNVIIECNIGIDVSKNTPVITNLTKTMGEFSGLRIEAHLGDVRYENSGYGVYEYLKQTVLANPHAQIEFIAPDAQRYMFPRAVDVVPKPPIETKPHILGITANDLVEFSRRIKESRISAFLAEEFSRVSSNKVKELQELLPDIDFSQPPTSLNWDTAEKLIKAVHTLKWIAPATDILRPIGKENVARALQNILNPQFIAQSDRSPQIFHGGIPYQVEVAIAYGFTNGAHNRIMRFANRVPLLFDAGACGLTEAVKTIEWKRYRIDDFENMPIAVFVNFVSVHVPYTSAGKQAIALEEEIIAEVRNAIMEAARPVKGYLNGIVHLQERSSRRKVFLRYVAQLAGDMSELADMPKKKEAIKKGLVDLVEHRVGLIEEAEDAEAETAKEANAANGAVANGQENGNGKKDFEEKGE